MSKAEPKVVEILTSGSCSKSQQIYTTKDYAVQLRGNYECMYVPQW